MKKILQNLSFIACLLLLSYLTSCIVPVVLTKNKTRIPDSLEGVWSYEESPDDLIEIRKKDDYWAFGRGLKSDTKKENKRFDLTFHRYENMPLVSILGWEEGEQKAFVVSYEIIDDSTIKFFLLKFEGSTTMNEGVHETNFLNTPEAVREPVFEEYLKTGKIKISEEPLVYKKRYSLNK